MLFIHVLPGLPPYAKYVLVDLTEHPDLQKDTKETAKLFQMLFEKRISYEVVNQISIDSKGQVLHLIY